VHEFVKISLRVHRNKKGWRALRYCIPPIVGKVAESVSQGH